MFSWWLRCYDDLLLVSFPNQAPLPSETALLRASHRAIHVLPHNHNHRRDGTPLKETTLSPPPPSLRLLTPCPPRQSCCHCHCDCCSPCCCCCNSRRCRRQKPVFIFVSSITLAPVHSAERRRHRLGGKPRKWVVGAGPQGERSTGREGGRGGTGGLTDPARD